MSTKDPIYDLRNQSTTRPRVLTEAGTTIIDLREDDAEAGSDGAREVVGRPAVGARRPQRTGLRPSPRPSPRPAAWQRRGRKQISAARLSDEIGRELHRATLARRPGILAAVSVAELARLRARLGHRAEEVLGAAIDELFVDAPLLEQHSARADGGWFVLMPETSPAAGAKRLAELSNQLIRSVLDVDGEQVRVTPVIGYAHFAATASSDELRDRAAAALRHAELHLDLLPVEYSTGLETQPPPVPGRIARLVSALVERSRVTLQIAFTAALLLMLPFLVYVLVSYTGFDLTTVTYPIVAVMLAGTAAGLWVESVKALAPVLLPARPTGDVPVASAIVAAYLPNEAATIMATLESMLGQDYPGELQIILAYNTPQHLPIEDALAALAARDPRLLLLRVTGSTSKAQNVNAALTHVRGDFVGVFDADHHPAPGSFERAWHWIGAGHDVVQGHCVVRNGEVSWTARLVAIEFEAVYAVSHPGRARLHGFGIFGGSNGYWRTECLRQIRMHGSMLTEDIDSSIRSLLGGLSIVSDPDLVSTELAPTTLSTLWHQRMRWAQGWTQTSRRHLLPAVRSPKLSLRQKMGAGFLLGWTQTVPWVTIQVIPILGYAAWRDGNLRSVDLFIPLFVLLSILTFSVGPAQAVFAYVLGVPEIRRHKGWFLLYALHSLLWYGELKNLIARVAQVKEATGERHWRVTPRGGERIATVVTADTLEGERLGRRTAAT